MQSSDRADGRFDGPAGGRGAGAKDSNAFLTSLPPGVTLPPGGNALDAISQNLGTMNPSQLMEVLAQMKVAVSLAVWSEHEADLAFSPFCDTLDGLLTTWRNRRS